MSATLVVKRLNLSLALVIHVQKTLEHVNKCCKWQQFFQTAHLASLECSSLIQETPESRWGCTPVSTG